MLNVCVELVNHVQDQSFGGFGYAKYGEPGNFGTGYWGRKSLEGKDPDGLSSWMALWVRIKFFHDGQKDAKGLKIGKLQNPPNFPWFRKFKRWVFSTTATRDPPKKMNEAAVRIPSGSF